MHASIFVVLINFGLHNTDEIFDKLPLEFHLSSLPGGNDFRSVPYLRVAIALQALGRQKSYEVLFNSKCDRFSLLVLCRMLFKAKEGGEFRRPQIGGPVFLDGSVLTIWPMEPIAIVDGVPFFIVTAYISSGPVESSAQYLEYCMKDCEWNDFKFKASTIDQRLKAAHALSSDPRFKKRTVEILDDLKKQAR